MKNEILIDIFELIRGYLVIPFVLLLFLPVMTSITGTVPITLNHFNISANLCSDSVSTISIYPQDKHNNSISIDNIKVNFPSNIIPTISQNSNRSIFIISLENLSNSKELSFNITGNQSNYLLFQYNTYNISSCNNFFDNIGVKLNEFEYKFQETYWYWIVLFVILVFVFVLLKLIRSYYKK